MKLFTRYNRVNITATILSFLAGSLAFYFVIHYVLIRQLNESLRAEQQEITEYVKLHDQLPEIQNTRHQWILIEKTDTQFSDRKTKSVPQYNSREKEWESYRQLTFTIQANRQLYKISVNKSETETEDLLQLIILVTVGMIALILLSNYLINRKLVNRLWKPFYDTLHQISDYQITSQQSLSLPGNTIDEIHLLNESLNTLSQRIQDDYRSLRMFTENASHEMQTPLAIIRSKVDALLQEAEGNEKMIRQLLVIEDAIQKLSKLHQSLLLLTKLENRQFPLTETVQFDTILRIKLEEREALLQNKSLHVSVQEEPVQLSFHTHLAEILISNLLNNAIRYTPENGNIEIYLTKEGFRIQNSAQNGALDSGKLFQRFYKADQHADGTGLGLAIIQEICSLAGYSLTYQFHDQQHDFFIRFIPHAV